MEHDKCTPTKIHVIHEYNVTNSPKVHRTPVKQAEISSKYKACNNTSCFPMLPKHITPPSGLTKFIARNPFESDLTNRLHLSVISPTVFSKVSSPTQHSPGFGWNVEELANLQPAMLEEFPIQHAHPVDPEVEIKAQAAIDRFFYQNQIIPSPWEDRKKENKLKAVLDTPTGPYENLNSSKESHKSKKDSSAQTVLSLPPELPPNIEEVLKPYFTFTQDQSVDNDDANSSNTSLRRKLFFNHNDCDDDDDDNDEDEEESSVSLSPVKMNESLVLPCSPPQSGMLIHGTPLRRCSRRMQRNHGTPIGNSEHLSPLSVSPIYSNTNNANNLSMDSIRSRSRSVVRLDFSMDVSAEKCVSTNKEPRDEKRSSNAPENVPEVKPTEKENLCSKNLCDNNEDRGTKPSVTIALELMSKEYTLFDNNAKNGIARLNNKHHSIIDRLKFLSDSCKLYASENCSLQQTNMLSVISDQQSISNSAQDTGYQTYSMNSNLINSSNDTPLKQKVSTGEKILYTEDEVQLSDWKENMRNVFCSTPSKYHKEERRDN